MKNFTKSIIGLSLVTIMAFTTSCGSVKEDAIASLDTVISNVQSGKAFVFETEIEGIKATTTRDADGNVSQVASSPDGEIGVYSIGGEISFFINGVNSSDLLDDATKQQSADAITETITEFEKVLTENRASLDTAFLVEVTEEGDNFVINTTNKEGGTPVVVTVAKDGSKYTFVAEDGTTETFTFSGDISVSLPQ